MENNNNPVWRFVRQLNAAFGSRMTADARKLYHDELSKWHLTEREWQQAMSIITAQESGERVPTLAQVYDYLRQAQREIAQDTPGRAALLWDTSDGRRHGLFYQLGMPRDDLSVLDIARIHKVPHDATNIRTVVLMSEEDRKRGLDTIGDWRSNPTSYPDGAPTQDGTHFKLSENGRQEVEEIKQQAITQHVNEDLDAYRVRLICLTQGHRGSMRKRELDSLEAQAREWAKTASESEIAEERLKAAEILTAKFAGVTALDGLVRAVAGEKQPADYDDSELALGRQRMAQLERLEAYERKREAFGDDF